MVNYIKKEVGILQANSYFVYNDKRECIIIDAGGSYAEMKDILEEYNFKPVALLLTHGHYDHIAGAKALQNEGVEVYIHEQDAEMLNTDKNLAPDLGMGYDKVYADHILSDGEKLSICGFDITVLHTPGHTKGGVCYLFDGVVFTGDTLFRSSIGRTDFDGGSYEQIIRSIKNKLFVLDDSVEVCAGHMSSSTIGAEKSCNPYLKD